MQKRLDIVCSLIHSPKILIMDEPTSDLDPIARSEMWDLIKEINKSGTTVVLASHFLTELEDICSRVGILHNRKIVEVGTPDQLRSIYSKDYEIIVETKEADYGKIESHIKNRKALRAQKIVKKGRRLVIYTPKPEETLSYLSKLIEKYDMKLVDANLNKPTLRELFEYLVKKDAK
jgi:ABC-2 type transport system ATP-binding protein